MDKILNFKFKGSRDYIHGTDMFNSVMDRLDGWNNFDQCSLNISHMTNKQLKLVKFDEIHNTNQVKVAVFRGNKFNEPSKNFSLIETTQEVNNSYEYDEEKITHNCVLSEKSLTISRLKEYTIIELLVASNKYLLNQIFNDINGKWVFTKFQSNNLKALNDARSFQLVFKKALGNLKLTVTEIIDLEKKLPLATINFSLI